MKSSIMTSPPSDQQNLATVAPINASLDLKGSLMADVALFVVISLGIAVSVLYLYGALKSRRASRM